MSLALRPRSAPQLVDAAVQLLRAHYAAFAVLSAIAFLPSIVLQVVDHYALDRFDLYVRRVVPLILLTVLWRALVDAAIQFAAAEAYLGRPVHVEQALRRAGARFGSLLSALLAKWILISLGLMLFVVPGILFFVRYFAVPATVVIEDLGAGAALARSRELAQTGRGKVLAALGLSWLLYIAMVLALTVALGGIVGPLVAPVLVSLLVMLVYPVLGILAVLLYFDLRMRREGFDLEMEMRALPGEPSAGLAS